MAFNKYLVYKSFVVAKWGSRSLIACRVNKIYRDAAERNDQAGPGEAGLVNN